MVFQRTLKRSVSIKGVGLHSGNNIKLTINPGRPGQGIVFVRTDIEGAPEIPAQYKHVINTQLATTLGAGKATISTVEHLLSALQGLGVDNALIEVNGPEIPILDGSAAPFVEAILEVGLESQLRSKCYLALRRRVEVKVNDKWGIAEPCSRFEVHGSIKWDHPAIGYQEFHYVEGKTKFAEVAGARTFGFLKDVEQLKSMGLCRGGSLLNAVVMDDNMVLNPEGLRFEDECVRHKVMDAIGDFKLAGFPILGYFRLHRAGHDLHTQLIAEILKDPDNYELIDTASTETRKPAKTALGLARPKLAVTY
jgi:UDP-3-O-[3-hydroxymyristoyl] N-acetylglucosamine deacetylase